MSEMRDKISPLDDKRRLPEAIRGAQIAAADRGDVVIDMKEADLARIEILADDLKPVFDEVPADDEQWDFAISRGSQPRLWIDATSHVMMGRDRRTYRFVRDTRLGRVIMAESSDVKTVSDAVTTYIAERIVERQRLTEGERISLRSDASDAAPLEQSEPVSAPVVAPVVQVRQHLSIMTDFVNAVIWILIGALAGAGALLAFFWDRLSPYF
ncbi:hypothetical protein HB779_19495 [Phyllobacterium sp. 628]|uniref:hypothetical protein n=1 Tax=Phyllobacterium sp. 628 TaxID=2718938 RepID=UPI00166284E9|nr:hypothetical protein [Phyllobacterium sp. 628]QND53835.1 hypothetical protein HB779_19495 [Phyllobacterium sp. 628]